jgi:hypothetical protein
VRRYIHEHLDNRFIVTTNGGMAYRVERHHPTGRRRKDEAVAIAWIEHWSAISTYLGHVCVRDTYWYLSACPGLMEEAARRLDRRWEAKP